MDCEECNFICDCECDFFEEIIEELEQEVEGLQADNSTLQLENTRLKRNQEAWSRQLGLVTKEKNKYYCALQVITEELPQRVVIELAEELYKLREENEWAKLMEGIKDEKKHN